MAMTAAITASKILESWDEHSQTTLTTPCSVYTIGGEGRTYLGAACAGGGDGTIVLIGDHFAKPTYITPRRSRVNGQEQAQADQVSPDDMMLNPLHDKAIMALSASPVRGIIEREGTLKDTLLIVTKQEPTTLYLLTGLLNSTKGLFADISTSDQLYDAAGKPAGAIRAITHASAHVIGNEHKTAMARPFFLALVTSAGEDRFGIGDSGIAIVTTTEQDQKTQQEGTYKKLLVQLDTAGNLTNENPCKRALALNNTSTALSFGGASVSINAITITWSSDIGRTLYCPMSLTGTSATDNGGICVIARGQCYTRAKPVPESAPENVKSTDIKKQPRPSERVTPEKATHNTTKERSQQPELPTTGTTEATDTKKEPQPSELMASVGPIVYPDVIDNTGNQIIGVRGQGVLTGTVYAVHTTKTTTRLDYIIIHGGITHYPAKRSIYALPLVNKPDDMTVHGMIANGYTEPLAFSSTPSSLALGRYSFVEPARKPSDMYSADDAPARVGQGPLATGDITQSFVYGDTVYAVTNQDNREHGSALYQSRAVFDELGRISSWTSWQRVHITMHETIMGVSLHRGSGNMTLLLGSREGQIVNIRQTAWGTGESEGLATLAEYLKQQFPKERGGIQTLYATDTHLLAAGLGTLAVIHTGYYKQGTLVPYTGKALCDQAIAYHDGTIHGEVPTSTNAVSITGGNLEKLGPIDACCTAPSNGIEYIWLGGVHGLARLRLDLPIGEQVTLIGSYHWVKKLIPDTATERLFIVTDKELHMLATNTQQTMLLATSEQISGNRAAIIHDVLYVNGACLVATTAGLFAADLTTEPQWKRVCMPENLEIPYQLQAVESTVYVLSTDKKRMRSVLHRCVVTQHHTVVPMCDRFLVPIPSYYVEFNGFKNWMYNDGVWFLYGRNRAHTTEDPKFGIVAHTLRMGDRRNRNLEAEHKVLTTWKKNQLHSVDTMLQPITIPSSGALLIATDDGILIHE